MIKRKKKNAPTREIEIKIRENGKIVDNASFSNRNLLNEYLEKFSLIGGGDEKSKNK